MSTPEPVEDVSLSIHRQVSVDFIRNSGALAVRVNPNDKSPVKGWSPRNNDKTITEIILRDANLVSYTDNLAVHLSGPLVDLDVDSNETVLMTALERFLPQSCHVWGHASRLRTHRVYQLKEDFDPSLHPFLRSIKKIPEIKLELRGGKQTSGQYCLVPGSTHPSGEPYLWANLSDARLSTAVVDLDVILKAIRMSGAITLLAPHWISGSRNELTMALTGFLFRTAKISESLAEDVLFQMTEAMARQFLETLMDICNDDPRDFRSRMKTFEKTWAKAEAGEAVTGGTTLAKLTGSDTLLPQLYLILSDSPDISLLDEFASRFAIWSGPGIIIDMQAAALGAQRPFMSRQQFCNSFGHKWIESGGKRKLVADLLFNLKLTQRLAGVTFEPGQEALIDTKEGKKINQWSGFAIAPHPEPVTEKEIEPFLNYIEEVICSKNEEVTKWVLGWLSHIFREPNVKAGTALVLVGLPGIGKSFLGEHFLIPIIGSHAVTTSSAERAAMGFNALFDNKIYIQCDEAISSRQRVIAARLKSLITDPTIVIEPKGIDPYEKPNHMRMLFTSNEVHDAVFLSDGVHDRRYTVIEVSSIHRGDINGYWRPLVTWANAEGNRGKIHRFLLDYSYQPSFIRVPLQTAAKSLMQEHSMNTFDRWLSMCVSRGFPLSEKTHRRWYDAPIAKTKEIRRDQWPLVVNFTALVEDLSQLTKNTLTEVQIKKEFNRRNLNLKAAPAQRLAIREFDEKEKQFVTRRIYLYGFPAKREIENYLREKYGMEPEKEEAFQELEVEFGDNVKEF